MRPKRANPHRQGGDWIGSAIAAYSAATLLEDFRTAQAKRIAGAHLLRLGTEGQALGRRQCRQRGGEGQHQTGLAECPGRRCSHVRLPRY